MAKLNEVFEKAAKVAEEEVGRVVEDEKLLRSLFLEEGIKQDDDAETDEEKSIVSAFEDELNQFINNWYKKHFMECKELHDVLLSLGEDSRRKIDARLITERKDTLRDIIDTNCLYFSDLVYLDDRAIQKVLREVDQQELAKALKGVDSEVKVKIFRNMSKRAAEMLKEDMEFMGPVRKCDVYEAEDKILAIIHKLEKSGDIVICKIPDDELIM